ncbi:MAG: LysM peptidoglycan-binding domain-containing protein, partial [Gammaproteobacteria bacterium]
TEQAPTPMNDFITRTLALVLALTASVAIAAQPLELAPHAPERYVVVKGDTLWDIAGRFLSKPWLWPDIWNLNREQIRNPHLIYPGDVVLLDRSGVRPRLRLARLIGSGGSSAPADGAGRDLPVEKLEPRVRAEPLARSAVPTISSAAIEAFLNRPLVVDEKGMAGDPRIVATQDGRVYLGRGDLAYALGIGDPGVRDWHIYRQARPIFDPDTRQPIAWEALFVGTARLERAGEPASLRITAVNEEIGVGDRLMPAEPAKATNYIPRPPETAIDGRIVAVYRGVSQVGRNSVVAINAGGADGLQVGHVLAIKHRGRIVTDRETKAEVRLPDEPVGHLLVFRVFDKIAYGLVMQASESISVGDDGTEP